MRVDLRAIELQRLQIQQAIDGQKRPEERSRLGQFATPHDLAVEIVRYIRELIGSSLPYLWVVDPALGTGSFFSALLSVYPRERIVAATGIEIDPLFVNAARELWNPLGFEVIAGDFTDPETRMMIRWRPNLIIANPPYVRHHYLTRLQKERLRSLVYRVTGIHVSGLAGLYVYFMLLAHEWLDDGGFGVWLIPSEFMTVKYGAALRTYLTKHVTLRAIHRFDPDDIKFSDALVSSTVVVVEKKPPHPDNMVRMSFGSAPTHPRLVEYVSVAELCSCDKWTNYPHGAINDTRTKEEVREVRLADLFHIKRGVATGANQFFILSRCDAFARGLPECFLRPILPSPRSLHVDVIEAGADGYPMIEPQLVLLDCNLPDYVVQVRYPALWMYLEFGKSQGLHERYLTKQRSPWYRQEHRDPAPFLCSYMGRPGSGNRAFRFVWNRSRAVAPNVWLLLYPVGPLARALRERPECESVVFEILCRISGRGLLHEGRVYGGGLYKLEPSELGRISAQEFLEEGVIEAPSRGARLAM